MGVATVVTTWGSSPCPVGSKLAFTLDYRIAGSVSGGCVESAVVEAGLETLSTGRPQLLRFGVADETAFRPRLRRADRSLRRTALACAVCLLGARPGRANASGCCDDRQRTSADPGQADAARCRPRDERPT